MRTSLQVRPWSWKQPPYTKEMDTFFVVSIRDGPSEEPRPSIQSRNRHTGPVLLNFSFITIAEGTEWQTLAITQCVLHFVLVEPDPRVSAARGQIHSSPLSLHLRDTRSERQRCSTHETLCGTSPRRGNGERLGCLFTICIQSSFDTAPCLSFSETTRRHSQ